MPAPAILNVSPRSQQAAKYAEFKHEANEETVRRLQAALRDRSSKETIDLLRAAVAASPKHLKNITTEPSYA